MSAQPQKKIETPKITAKVLSIQKMPTRSNQRRIEWDVIVSPETTVKEILDPAWWGHVAASTFSGPINYVNIHWEDKSQLVHGYVVQYSSTFAKIEVLDKWIFGGEKIPFDDLYSIDWGGPETKHRVIRKSDSQLIRDGFEKKEEALEFVKSLPK